MNLLFKGFEGSNEENWQATEGRGSVVKCGETPFEGKDETRIYILETENRCWSDCERMKMLCCNLAMCQLATWAENAVKFKLKLSKNLKRKPNEKEV